MNSVSPQPQATHGSPAAEEQLAGLCKAAADPLRLRVLRLLRHDAMDVSELCEILGVRQPALSHHLKLMSTAGLLSSQRDGNHIFYRRRELCAGSPLAPLQQTLFGAADALRLDDDAEERRASLLEQRESNSLDFFRHNAARFREQQDLIAAPEKYAAAVETLLDSLPANTTGTALEVGPGEGWLLPRLSRQFEQVVALDNAPTMLDAARRSADEAGVANIDFILGDTGHPRLRDLQAHLVVMNMVLHHTPNPAATLREAALALAPAGSLLLTELCEHRQDWARENCGDLWLGFAPQQIDEWAADAGLAELTSSYLGQRNGFKLQVRLFGAAQTLNTV